MDAKKRKRLAAAGWKTGTASDFLELSAEEAALVETRLAVSRALRMRRQELGVTQTALARSFTRANRGSQRWKPATRAFRSICCCERSSPRAQQSGIWHRPDFATSGGCGIT